MRAPADPVEIDSYGRVARSVHWLVASLAVLAVALGLAIPGAPRESVTRDALLLLHRSFGLSILLVMLFRLAWRLTHAPPPLPAGFPRLQAFAAHADHALLYLLFIAMPLSGYINAAAAGHSVNFFGIVAIPPLAPQSPRLSQTANAVHLTTQFLIYLAVAAHIGAALLHRLRGPYRILERMLPLRRPA